MAELTTTYSMRGVDGLVTNCDNRIEVTSESTVLRLSESERSTSKFLYVGGLDLVFDNGEYIVNGIGDALEDAIVIPSTFNNCPVTSIANRAFADKTLTSIHIPSSVRKIGNMAFAGCTSLASVTIDDIDKITIFFQAPDRSDWGKPYIHYQYGQNGENATEFPGEPMTLVSAEQRIYTCEIPLDAYSVSFNQGDIAGERTGWFYTRTSNPSACVLATTPANTLPGAPVLINYELKCLEDNIRPLLESSLSIGNSAFDGCTALKRIDLPRRTQYMGVRTFEDCTSLDSVSIPQYHRLAKVGSNAFLNCKNLRQVQLENGVKEIDMGAFSGCWKLEMFNWVSTLTTIGEEAFKDCYYLQMFTIPSSVKTIEKGAFLYSRLPSELPEDVIKEIPEISDTRIISFADPYTWFVSPEKGNDYKQYDVMLPNEISDGITNQNSSVNWKNGNKLSLASNYANHYWYKMKQMPTPTISLDDDGVLSMADPLGQAERFYIYVNGKRKVTIEV